MRVLHVGCGGHKLPADIFPNAEEIQLDIDPSVSPDIVASVVDMGEIGQFDAIYSSHQLEHLYPHEVGKALSEFMRVLRPGGVAMVIVPDLEGLEPTDEVLYEVHGMPITKFELFYGHLESVKTNPFMAHKCGFTADRLKSAFEAAGFIMRNVSRCDGWQVVAVGQKAAP